MKHLTGFRIARVSIVAVATVALAVACNKSSSNNGGGSPTGPTGVVTTSTQTYTVPLIAAAETPAITGAEASVAGNATIKFNLTKTDGVLTAATADFSVNLTGFPTGSSVTISHIHQGAGGVKGAIIVDTGLAAGQVTLTGGAGTFQKNGITMATDVAQSIMNAPAGFYFNVHSAANPGGVVRGQVDGTSGLPATAGGGATTDPTTPPSNGYVDPTI